MSVINDYEKWKKHYVSMIEGKVSPNRNIFLVNDINQSGQGLRMVSPSTQMDNMTRSIIKKSIKPHRKKRKSQSSTKTRRLRTIKKSAKSKTRRKKVIKKRKAIRRKR